MGSNLVDVLMLRGEYVIVIDNFFTGIRTLLRPILIRALSHFFLVVFPFLSSVRAKSKYLFLAYTAGRKRNVEHWIGHPNFELVTHDVGKVLECAMKANF